MCVFLCDLWCNRGNVFIIVPNISQQKHSISVPPFLNQTQRIYHRTFPIAPYKFYKCAVSNAPDKSYHFTVTFATDRICGSLCHSSCNLHKFYITVKSLLQLIQTGYYRTFPIAPTAICVNGGHSIATDTMCVLLFLPILKYRMCVLLYRPYCITGKVWITVLSLLHHTQSFCNCAILIALDRMYHRSASIAPGKMNDRNVLIAPDTMGVSTYRFFASDTICVQLCLSISHKAKFLTQCCIFSNW